MKLNKIALENFQGIKELELEFDGQNASIYGDNGTGKTTVANGFTWLMFDRAASDTKGFSPKPIGKDGSEIHNLTTSVSAEINIEGQGNVILTKQLKEKWTKKRGSTSAVFEGNVTEYAIDGVPFTKTKYEAFIYNLGLDGNKVKLLTMPSYFPEVMKWQDRRSLLFEISGDLSDESIISATYELHELENVLKKPGSDDARYSVDEYLKIAKKQMSQVNKDLDKMPDLISEAQKAIPDTGRIDYEYLKEKETDLEHLIEAKRKEKDALNDVSAESAYRLKLAEIVSQERLLREQHVTNQMRQKEPLKGKIRELQSRLDDVTAMRRSEQRKLDQNRSDLDTMRKYAAELKKQIREIGTQQFDEDSTICPTCGQPFPPEKSEQLRTDFNIKKSEKLEALEKRGLEHYSKAAFAEQKNMIEANEERISQLDFEMNEFKSQLDDLETQIKSIKAVPFEDTEDYLEIQKQKRELDENKPQSVDPEKLEALDTETSNLKIELESVRKSIYNFSLAERQEKRVQELEEKQKELAVTFEELEKNVNLCERFIQVKVDMTSALINAKFRSVQFKLFDTQINGGLKECCDVMIPCDGRLVPYQFANNASRINAGLEIVECLSEHYGIMMPVFVDNAESVTELEPIANQVIRLVVSEGDKVLRKG